MKKILVPTDLSKNSKAGVKFAIQLATQYDVHLVFFYAIELLIPTRWNDVRAKLHMDEEIQAESEHLHKFIVQAYKESKRRPGKFSCMVRYGAPVSDAILDCADEIGASHICMGTQGAGKIARIFGTHAAAVIKDSPIPVFAVPKNYKNATIKQILYATDLKEVKAELQQLKKLAKLIKSSISVIHYYDETTSFASRLELDKLLSSRTFDGVEAKIEKFNSYKTFEWHLSNSAKKYNADIVTLFTEQKRPWLQRLLKGSKSREVAFSSTKPLLVYPK